jgi:hypothetical protein
MLQNSAYRGEATRAKGAAKCKSGRSGSRPATIMTATQAGGYAHTHLLKRLGILLCMQQRQLAVRVCCCAHKMHFICSERAEEGLKIERASQQTTPVAGQAKGLEREATGTQPATSQLLCIILSIIQSFMFRSSSLHSPSARLRRNLAGLPAHTCLLGTTVPGGTSAPAATTEFLSTCRRSRERCLGMCLG